MKYNKNKAPSYPDGAPLGVAMSRIVNGNDVRPIYDPVEAKAVIAGAVADNTPDVIRALHAIGGPIRKLRRRFENMPREEFDSTVALVLLETLRDFDPEDDFPSFGRIGHIVIRRGTNALTEASPRVIDVPLGTLARYYQIDKAARAEARDANLMDHTFIALRIAGERGMKPATFLAVRDALTAEAIVPRREDDDTDPYDHIDKRAVRFKAEYAESSAELVARAFAAVNEEEARVVAVAYGFADMFPEADHNARSDAEVAERIKMSRAKVQRIRTGALRKMKVALLGQ